MWGISTPSLIVPSVFRFVASLLSLLLFIVGGGVTCDGAVGHGGVPRSCAQSVVVVVETMVLVDVEFLLLL